MENSTQIVSFVLTQYGNLGDIKNLFFFLTMLLYILVIISNTVLIVIIYVDRNLHEPMYLFLCSLFVNEIYGSTSILPCIMVHFLSETHEISTFYCFIQIFNIQTYVAIEFGTLTIMAYDRYVCICKPLYYNVMMSTRKVEKVIFVIWIVSFLEFAVLLSFTFRLKFCGRIINDLLCQNHLVLELSCSPDRTVSYVNDLVFGLIFTVAAPLCFIFFSYVNILAVCLKASEETKMKAFDTCTPHLVSLISFVSACFYNMITQRFDMTVIPLELRAVLSLYGLIQPFVHPMIYGLKLSKIRHAFKKFVTLKSLKLYHKVKLLVSYGLLLMLIDHINNTQWFFSAICTYRYLGFICAIFVYFWGSFKVFCVYLISLTVPEVDRV